VLFGAYYLGRYYEQNLKAVFPDLNRWIGGSFWIRRKPSPGVSDPSKPKET